MLPTLEGVIARRLLLNFRADPIVVRGMIPEGLELATVSGSAVVGVCLIRLEQLRPKGMPAFFGLAAESMAHRVAIRYPTRRGWGDGVFIWRRETDCPLIAQLGGRLFPGVHRAADFHVLESALRLTLDVLTDGGEADVAVQAVHADSWPGTPLFRQMDDASGFFERGECGFSCARDDHSLEAIRLHALRWNVSAVRIESVHAAFYANARRFPPGSVAFDSALLMRNLAHEWQEAAVPARDTIPVHPGLIRTDAAR
jgi:hypothetical protein